MLDLVGRRLLLALAFLCGGASAAAQRSPLIAGGSDAGAGVHALRAGFSPDPFSISVPQPGGPVRVTDLRLGAGCRGFVSARPDAIVRFSGAAPFLRFNARASADLTLVVRDPSGRFLCNDDAMPGSDTNPVVDLYQPRAGQYDVWIGAPSATEHPSATLLVTQRP
jgi:hypothetical protein